MMKNSTKFWICHNSYVDGDVKVRNYCHISGRNRISVHRGCNIDVKLNHKISVVFHNLKKYYLHLNLQ